MNRIHMIFHAWYSFIKQVSMFFHSDMIGFRSCDDTQYISLSLSPVSRDFATFPKQFIHFILLMIRDRTFASDGIVEFILFISSVIAQFLWWMVIKHDKVPRITEHCRSYRLDIDLVIMLRNPCTEAPNVFLWIIRWWWKQTCVFTK